MSHDVVSNISRTHRGSLMELMSPKTHRGFLLKPMSWFLHLTILTNFNQILKAIKCVSNLHLWEDNNNVAGTSSEQRHISISSAQCLYMPPTYSVFVGLFSRCHCYPPRSDSSSHVVTWASNPALTNGTT
jgi:hypothetical protein